MIKKYISFLILATLWLSSEVIDVNIAPKDTAPMYINILDQKELKFKKIDNFPFAEISDITYDKNNNKLYMVSDKGYLFGFSADFNQTIEKLEPIYGAKLTKKNGTSLKTTDAEGLAMHPQDGLIISFERHPMIASFGYDGRLKKNYQLPSLLHDIHHYQGRNKALEALAYHPTYGIITAAEYPLKGMMDGKQAIYSLNRQVWHFTPTALEKNGLVAIEVMDDGNILVLERAVRGLYNPFVISLKKIYLDRCDHSECQSQTLAILDNAHGWKTQNFEGLAHIGENRFVMISDDSSSIFQKTIIVYFEVLSTAK